MLWTDKQGQVLENRDLTLEQARDTSICIAERTLWLFRAHGLGVDGQGDGSRAVVRQETVAVVQVNMRRGGVKVATQRGMGRSGSQIDRTWS